MLKRFFVSLLASIAGFWIAIILAFLAFLLMIAAVVANSSGDKINISPNTILYLDLKGEVIDRPVTQGVLKTLYNVDKDQIALNDIVNALDNASDDKNIAGLYIHCDGAVSGIAQAQAVNDAVKRFKKSGKWVIAYADSYTQGNYYMASAADSIFLNPIGSVDIHGLASSTPFFKGLLDKIGVEVQVVKVGTYKSAVEPYILEHMSEPAREQQVHFLNNIWGVMKDNLAEARHLDAAAIDSMANDFIFTAKPEDAVKRGLITDLRYRHQVESTLMSLTDCDDPDDLNLVTPSQYCSASTLKSLKGKKNIAVLYAVGDIVDDGKEGIVGHTVADQIFDLSDDDDIDGLILRVNSGGGSAFASEQIWEALEQWKANTGKPFYVSMCDYAASGGYYISCGADSIFAEPVTITGSIGIFGMIPNAQNALNNKLGVNIETVETNNNANFPTIFQPMTDTQKQAMQGYVDRGYELFVSRVAAGRHMSVDSVKMIAEGRVWDGKSALEIGLVDCLGGLDKAVEAMAARLGVEADDIRISEYPDPTENWLKQFTSLSVTKLKAWALEDEFDPTTMALYRALNYVNSMSTLQCRMPIGEVK